MADGKATAPSYGAITSQPDTSNPPYPTAGQPPYPTSGSGGAPYPTPTSGQPPYPTGDTSNPSGSAQTNPATETNFNTVYSPVTGGKKNTCSVKTSCCVHRTIDLRI